MNKERLLNALYWIIMHGFDSHNQFTEEEWAIAKKAVRIIEDAFFNGQESPSNEEAIDEALKSYNK